MGTNALLDIAIGLALFYLLLSLFVTIINEWIGSIAKLRARNLRRAISKLVDDPSLRTLVNDSPFLESLKAVSGRVGPSFIPADRFVVSLLGALGSEGTDKASIDLTALRQRVEGLPESKIRKQLLFFIDQAENEVKDLKVELAAWFDDVMDRASGIYRRWMQILSFVVSATVVVALNANTISIAEALWRDDVLRAQISASAVRVVEGGEEASSAKNIGTIQDELRPFPIGWTTGGQHSDHGPLTTLLGWFLTAAAVSLGAPFWFGILEKVTKIRGAGETRNRRKSESDSDGAEA